jgi:hypothetical protein
VIDEIQIQIQPISSPVPKSLCKTQKKLPQLDYTLLATTPHGLGCASTYADEIPHVSRYIVMLWFRFRFVFANDHVRIVVHS